MSRLTGEAVTEASFALNGSAQLALAANNFRQFLQIVNSGANNVTYTLDGSTPSASNGIVLVPNGSATYDTFVPTGAVNVLGTNLQTVQIVSA